MKARRNIICLVPLAVLLATLLATLLLAGCSTGERGYPVKPSGTDDTAAIQAAIDEALVDGPGGVIQLTAGDYYLSGPVIAPNFSGTLRGKGPEQTVLHLVPGTPLALWTGSDTAQPGVLFAFEYDTVEPASLTVQDLGLSLVGQAQPYEQEGAQANALRPFWVSGIGGTRPVSTTFTNLAVRGDPDLFGEGTFNIETALTLRSLSGAHTISRSVFESLSNAILLDGTAGASVTLGGASEEDLVTLAQMRLGIVSYTGVNDVQLEVAHVDASREVGGVVSIYKANASRIHLTDVSVGGGHAIFLYPCTFESGFYGGAGLGGQASEGQACGDEPYTLLVENSDIVMPPEVGHDFAGIEIWQSGDSEIVIRNNTFHGAGTYEFGPIWLCGTANAQITGNTFLGHGPGAVHVGMGNCGEGDTGATISDNDFSQWVQDGGEFEPDWHGQAPIWLGVRTSGITVSGCGDPKVVVYDETDRINTPDYDGNNIIEGLSPAQSGG